MEINPYDGLQAYKTYLAITRHFNSSYDYFKYIGKIKVKDETFLKRRDKFFFKKLQKKHKNDLPAFLVSIIISGKSAAPALVCNEESEEIYMAWKKRQESLTYMFKKEMESLKELTEKGLNKLLHVPPNEHPELLHLHLNRNLSAEAMIMMDAAMNFFPFWNLKINDIVWQTNYKKLKKYTPFIQHGKTDGDIKKIKKILLNLFDD